MSEESVQDRTAGSVCLDEVLSSSLRWELTWEHVLKELQVSICSLSNFAAHLGVKSAFWQISGNYHIKSASRTLSLQSPFLFPYKFACIFRGFVTPERFICG